MSKRQYTRHSNRQYLSRAIWEKHVAEFHASGLSTPEYSRQHNLVLPTFRNWIRRLDEDNKGKAQPAFMPVKVNVTELTALDTDNAVAQDIHITLPNGIQCTFTARHIPKLILPWIEYLRVLP